MKKIQLRKTMRVHRKIRKARDCMSFIELQIVKMEVATGKLVKILKDRKNAL